MEQGDVTERQLRRRKSGINEGRRRRSGIMYGQKEETKDRRECYEEK